MGLPSWVPLVKYSPRTSGCSPKREPPNAFSMNSDSSGRSAELLREAVDRAAPLQVALVVQPLQHAGGSLRSRPSKSAPNRPA